jgi:uncharacterized membrane protein
VAFSPPAAEGLHPLWTTAMVFAIASVVIVAARPRAAAQVVRSPALWLLLLASGTTNATFNWAIVIGDVVRVVLLFYLMPLWAVLLARFVLGERLTAAAALRVVLGVAGAMIVLSSAPPAGQLGWPIPRALPTGWVFSAASRSRSTTCCCGVRPHSRKPGAPWRCSPAAPWWRRRWQARWPSATLRSRCRGRVSAGWRGCSA